MARTSCSQWLFERGIGEDRAVLVDDGAIVEAVIERPGLRARSVVEARLTSILMPGKRGLATTNEGAEILIEPLGRVTEGAAVRVVVAREAIAEPGAIKRAKGQVTDAELVEGPDLAARIGTHRLIGPHDADALEDAGWSETLEMAATGIVPFAGGTLRITLTPAMTLIDVDGGGDSDALAKAGATAAARAIRLFGIQGNIGIDLPTVGGRAARQAIGAAFDVALPQPFERTAVNGFGFLQVVRPRVRPSLCEQLRHDPAGSAARALMRTIQRSGSLGTTTVDAPAAVRAVIADHPDWTAALARQIGGRVIFR